MEKIFLFVDKNIYCVYSLEMSDEYSENSLCGQIRKKKSIF